MNNPERTLVILTPGFPENEADSTCLPAQQIFVKALKSNFPSLQLLVLTFQYPFNHVPYLWHGIRIIPFNGRNRRKLYRLQVWLRVLLQLNKFHHEKKVIGLFSFWCTECALIGKYFSRFSGIEHLSWISGQDAGKDNRYVSFIRPRANELVAMSDFLAREFLKNHFVKPAFIIPNGIDSEQFQTAAVKRDLDISAAGSLIKLKKFDIFVDVIHHLKKHIPGIRSVICGQGPEEQSLRNQVATLQLENNISLVGSKSHAEVLQVMKRSKIFLHPSSYEGYSSVCLEALYAGAHVISFWSPSADPIKHWHIVSSKEEMISKALEILHSTETDHDPVLVHSMSDSAKAVMELFERKSKK